MYPACTRSAQIPTHEPVQSFLRAFRAQIQLVEPMPPSAQVCRDPDDDIVLATGVAAAADRIVTGDRDLLVLRVYKGIRLVSPRQFLEWLGRRERLSDLTRRAGAV